MFHCECTRKTLRWRSSILPRMIKSCEFNCWCWLTERSRRWFPLASTKKQIQHVSSMVIWWVYTYRRHRYLTKNQTYPIFFWTIKYTIPLPLPYIYIFFFYIPFNVDYTYIHTISYHITPFLIGRSSWIIYKWSSFHSYVKLNNQRVISIATVPLPFRAANDSPSNRNCPTCCMTSAWAMVFLDGAFQIIQLKKIGDIIHGEIIGMDNNSNYYLYN